MLSLKNNTRWRSKGRDIYYSAGKVGIGKIPADGYALDVDGAIRAIDGNSTDWNTAYGWGDHALAGYLTSYAESDPVFAAWDKSAGISITESQISDLSHFSKYMADLLGASDERVPFASGFGGLTDSNSFKYDGSKLTVGSSNSNKWALAYGWGDHSVAGYLTGYTETDPVFAAWNKSTGIVITESQISDLSHTPAFNGDIAAIYNAAGDLKIMPDVQGDVILFGDSDVGDAVDGNEIRGWRNAPEGNNYWRIYVTSAQSTLFHSNANIILQNSSGKNIQFNSGQHIYFNLGDQAGADEVRIRDNAGLEVGKIDSNGNAWFRGDVSIGVDGDVLIQANGNSYFNGGNVGFGANITVVGTVDGINVGVDVAANTVHSSGDGTDHSRVIDNTGSIIANINNIAVNSSELQTKAPLASPALTGDVTVDDNYVLEGDSDGKNIVRKIQLQVANGATPGTNIDITKSTTQGRAYNAPTITDANDLAKSGSSGSYSLSANGENLTLDLTETVHTVLSVGVISDDLNDGGGGGYYVHTLVINGNIQLMVEKSGNTTNLDWTDVTNTGSDFIIFDITFMTLD